MQNSWCFAQLLSEEYLGMRGMPQWQRIVRLSCVVVVDILRSIERYAFGPQASGPRPPLRLPSHDHIDRRIHYRTMESEAEASFMHYLSCEVVSTPDRGRILIASSDLPEGTIVCKDFVHVACPLEETKKKVCAGCLGAAFGRLERQCHSCKKAFFCSEACVEDSINKNALKNTVDKASRSNAVPHVYLCEALQVLAKGRFDKQLTALLRVVLELYAWRKPNPNVNPNLNPNRNPNQC